MRMAGMHLAQECRFRRTHIGERLTGFRIGIKYDEIDRVSAAQRHTHLGFALEAADPAAVAGPRIDDDPRPAFLGRG